MRATWVIALAVGLSTATLRAASAERGMIALNVEGQTIEATPLHWTRHQVYLLGRDGRLWQIDPAKASDYRWTSNRFQSYSPSELRARLLRELGDGFEVTGTTHYLVAHANGQRDQWAQRFEDLYRSLVHYFSVRGLRLADPPVPLLGIVCRNQREFLRHSAQQGMGADAGILGYYCIESNRIVLYDASGGASPSADWQQNAAVIIHEATHQTAFNTGIHSRYAPPPVWVAEGLATMFEARGVYDSRRYTQQSDRINRQRLEDFRRAVAPRHRPELLADIVARDDLFHVSPGPAYAEAWALTFYLVETQPRNYAEYLARTGKRPAFQPYTAAQRIADFTSVFGADWRMLEAQLLRFVAGLK